MCDDITESENGGVAADHWWYGQPLARREFAAISAGAAAMTLLTACGPMANAAAAQSAGDATRSRMVTVPTPDGQCDGFFVFPETGRHPAVILWPDIAGLRPAYQEMATRLAAEGYAVLVVNQYYRSAPAPVLASFAEWRTDAGRARLQPMIAAINPAATMRDGGAFVTWLDQQSEVDTAKKIASSGYCMGGPFTFRTAAASPARVGAIASFHGGGLVTETGDSPHLLIGGFSAAMLIAVAQNDDARAPGDKDTLRSAAEAVGRFAEVEVYPAQHGWCTIDAPVYDAAQAERAWARMLALFSAQL
jgi:carboxymethylenebutenolidase